MNVVFIDLSKKLPNDVYFINYEFYEVSVLLHPSYTMMDLLDAVFSIVSDYPAAVY